MAITSMNADRRLHITLPKYTADDAAWAEAIRVAARAEITARGFSYSREDRLQVELLFYMRGGLAKRDVDNRIKQVLDALKGTSGVFPDDNQVFRIVAEKRELPADTDKSNGGWLTVELFRQT